MAEIGHWLATNRLSYSVIITNERAEYGHFVMLEAPEEFNGRLDRLIESILK